MPLIALVYPSQDEALIKGRVIGPAWNTPDEARQELARELKAARDRGVATDLAGYLVEVDGQYRVQKVTRATRASNGSNGYANPSTREPVAWASLVEKAKAHLAQLASKTSQEDAVKAVLAASGMERKQLRTLVDEVAPAPEQPARTAAQLVRAAEVKAMRRWDTAVAEDFPSLTQSSVEEVAAEAARQAGPDADAEKLDEALRAKAEELADVQKLVHDHVVKVGTTAAVGHVSTLLEQDGSWAGQQAGRLLKEMLRQCPECPGPHKLPKQLEAELPDPAPRTPREQIPLAFERLAWADAQRAQTQRAEKQRAPVPPEEPGPDRSDVERRRTARPEVQMEQGVFRAPARGEWKEKAEPEKAEPEKAEPEKAEPEKAEKEREAQQYEEAMAAPDLRLCTCGHKKAEHYSGRSGSKNLPCHYVGCACKNWVVDRGEKIPESAKESRRFGEGERINPDLFPEYSFSSSDNDSTTGRLQDLMYASGVPPALKKALHQKLGVTRTPAEQVWLDKLKKRPLDMGYVSKVLLYGEVFRHLPFAEHAALIKLIRKGDVRIQQVYRHKKPEGLRPSQVGYDSMLTELLWSRWGDYVIQDEPEKSPEPPKDAHARHVEHVREATQPAADKAREEAGERHGIDRTRANLMDLLADYKHRGMDAREAWNQLIKDRSLKPDVDFKEMAGYYKTVSASPLRAKPTQKQVPEPEKAAPSPKTVVLKSPQGDAAVKWQKILEGYHKSEPDDVKTVWAKAQELVPGIRQQDAIDVVAEWWVNGITQEKLDEWKRENRIHAPEPKRPTTPISLGPQPADIPDKAREGSTPKWMNCGGLEDWAPGQPGEIWRRVREVRRYSSDGGRAVVDVEILEGPEKGRVVTAQNASQLRDTAPVEPERKDATPTLGPQPADIPDKAWALVTKAVTARKPETQAVADGLRDKLLVRVREELAKRKG